MHFLLAALASFLPRLVANLAIFLFLNHCLHKHFAVAVQLLLLLRRLVRCIYLHASMESWPALCTSLIIPWLLHLACSRPPLCALSLADV